jgi:hypothetical protein
VGDLARGAHFTEEAPQALGVRVESGREELEGDRLTELQVVGPVDLTHPASSIPPRPRSPMMR